MKDLAKGLMIFWPIIWFLHLLNNYGYIQILIFLVFMFDRSLYV